MSGMSEALAGKKRRALEQLPEGPVGPVVKRTMSLSGPQSKPPLLTKSRSDQGPRAGQGVKMTMDEAKKNLLAMSGELNELINTQVSQIKEEDDFVGNIGGPLEAPEPTAAERVVATKVLGEGNVTREVVGQARTIVASMIAGLIAYSNQMGVLGPAVDAAAGVAGVGVEAAAGAASASVTMLNGLLSMPSPLMTAARAAVPMAGFLCNPNVLALLPILFLGYSLSGKDARQSLTDVLKSSRDAIVEKVEKTYNVSKEAAEKIVTKAESVIQGVSDKTISMIQAVSELYLKLFATACAVVKGMKSVAGAVGSAPQNIQNALVSIRESLSERMGQARAGVGSFADRIREATMRAAEGVKCQLGGEEGPGAGMGGRKTRKRVGRRHRHRGKRGASTRKGKGKGRGKGKGKGRGHRGSTRKGKGKSKGRGKAKGKGRGSSTRRRHSRKH